MTKSDINELIVKHFTGEISDLEAIRLNEWRSASERNERVFQKLVMLWNSYDVTPELMNSEDLVDKIWNASQEKETRKTTKHVSWNYLLKVAASILIVVSVSFGIYRFAVMQANTVAESKPAPPVIKENPAGQKIKIYLPDRTVVWLNSSSRLEYDQTYNQADRRVKLEGEAFFEVTEDKSKPFIVLSGDLKTTALGTSFNVSAYPDDKKIGISLVTGKVKIENTGKEEKEVILLPGYELIHMKEKGQHYERAFDPMEVAGWKEGILSFKGASYQETVIKLERWYGVEVRTEGTPPENLSLTTFYKEESLVNILKNLKFGKEFDYELKEDLLLIKFH